MILRGEFVRGDGLRLPNNITTYGAALIFQLAFQDSGYAIHMALADCNPDPLLDAANLGEPTFGVGGYARQSIARSNVGWNSTGTTNGESYMESAPVEFPATNPYSKSIRRLALVNHATDRVGQIVVALSSPFDADLLISPTLTAPERTFRYRIYGR